MRTARPPPPYPYPCPRTGPPPTPPAFFLYLLRQPHFTAELRPHCCVREAMGARGGGRRKPGRVLAGGTSYVFSFDSFFMEINCSFGPEGCIVIDLL